MNHLVDFLTVMSWFWLVMSIIVLCIMYKNYVDGIIRDTGWYSKPLPWIIILTTSYSWLLVTL